MKSKLLMADIICPLLLVALFATTASAQKIKIGLQAGGNYSGLQMTLQNHPDYTNNTHAIGGGQANLFLERPFGASPFSISAEPGIVVKGYNDLVGDLFPKSRVNFRFGYANLPLVFNYHPTERLGLSIGTEFNYLVTYYLGKSREDFLVKNNFVNRFEIAGLAGAQYNITKHVVIGTRFTYGLTPLDKIIFTDDEGNSISKVARRNMSGQVFVRYVI